MKTYVVVEVEGYDGETGQITVRNDGDGTDDAGSPDILYCVGRVGDDGVVRLVDWGYPTIDEARAAWPNALADGRAVALGSSPPGRA